MLVSDCTIFFVVVYQMCVMCIDVFNLQCNFIYKYQIFSNKLFQNSVQDFLCDNMVYIVWVEV